MPPTRHLSVHEVEEQPKGYEAQRGPYAAECIRWSQAVAHRRQNGHEATEAWPGLGLNNSVYGRSKVEEAERACH
jgi:hypothetical protein